MILTPEELAHFGAAQDDGDDDWGFESEPAPAPKVGRLNFTDESTTPDAELKAQRQSQTAAPAPAVTTSTNGRPMREAMTPEARATFEQGEADRAAARAAVIPPDAPPNSADVPAPEKAKRGRKPAVTGVADVGNAGPTIADVMDLLRQILAKLG